MADRYRWVMLSVTIIAFMHVTGSFTIAFLVAAAVQAVAFVAGLFVAEPARDAYDP